MKVSIIGGGGLVGSCAASALQFGGIVNEIALVDVNRDLVGTRYHLGWYITCFGLAAVRFTASSTVATTT